jgi:hypothetical protein
MKSAQQSAEKYVRNAGAASQDYLDGAANTSKDQAAEAIKAAPNYVAGIQASISGKRYEKGLGKSGKAKWLKGVTEKGAGRFAGGIQASAGDYATNSARFDSARGAAASIARGPKGSAGNLQRVAAVVNALRAVKTS